MNNMNMNEKTYRTNDAIRTYAQNLRDFVQYYHNYRQQETQAELMREFATNALEHVIDEYNKRSLAKLLEGVDGSMSFRESALDDLRRAAVALIHSAEELRTWGLPFNEDLVNQAKIYA